MELALLHRTANPPQNDEVIRYLPAAISLRDNAPCRVLLGNAFAESGRWEEAIAAHRRAVAVQPSAEGFEQLGKALAHEARWPEAAEAYRQAIQLSLRNEPLQRSLADALQRQSGPAHQ